MTTIPNGVNCTMLVPYTKENQIDLETLDKMIDWYFEHGCASLFAMCHSTEMWLLTQEERVAVVKQAKKSSERIAAAKGRYMPIIATGTFSDDLGKCLSTIKEIKEAGADAVVIVTNRLDPQNEGASVFLERLQWLLEHLPSDFPLGLYESPYPYRRVMTVEELVAAAEYENMLFLKDTCCDPEMLKARLEAIKGRNLKLFNANAQTLLYSLRLGAVGYSSVMANIHPELYAWLCKNYERFPKEAEELQEKLCFCSFTESLSYPLIAKYVMRQSGVPLLLNSRVRKSEEFTPYHRIIMDQLISLTQREMEHCNELTKSNGI